MNKKIKWFGYGGIIGTVIAVLLEAFLLSVCTSNLACVGINLILFYPALYISKLTNSALTTSFDVLVNAIVYFILGGIIGLIVYKVKNKK